MLFEQEKVPLKSDHPKIDVRLLPLIGADDQQYQALLDGLIEEHAKPLVHKIIGSKLNRSRNAWFNKGEHADAEDLRHEALVKLIAHLKLLRTNPEDYAIAGLEDFVAKIAFNVYNNYLRQKYPQWHRLKRRLQHLLKSREEFDLWKGSSEKLAGLVQWSGVSQKESHHDVLNKLREDSRAFALAKLGGQPLSQVPLNLLLAGLFEWTDHPIEIDLLVDVIADLLGIKDLTENELPDDYDDSIDELISGDGTLEFQQREYLTLLWSEIKLLPVRQRHALLLNLKDSQGDGVINALPLCRIASPEAIAEALEMKIENLEKIWDKFPLKDTAIGSMLGGLPAQAIINLRKSARERLSRRMKAILKPAAKNKF